MRAGRERSREAALDRSVVSADNGEVQRLRGEVQALGGIADAADLAAALDLVDRAVAQVSRSGLRALTERLGAAYGRALARLRHADRLAVRQAVREAAASEEGVC